MPQTIALRAMPASPLAQVCRLDALHDRAFIELLRGYRCHGGLARESELPGRCGTLPQAGGEGTSHAPWCRPIRFEWNGMHWLPLFQFEPGTFTLRDAPRRVIEALSPAFDGWSLATWFAEANCWLAGAMPVQRLDADLPAVLEAARADRFIAAG
jgi:hypothetical protein